MANAIVLTQFGDISNHKVCNMILQLREYTDCKIYVFTDEYKNLGDKNTKVMKVQPYWKGHSRYGWRNSDYWRIAGTGTLHPTTYMYVDLDMLILGDRFLQGFDYANRFGMCVPASPRHYVGVDAHKGLDPDGGLRGSLATAMNVSPMFYNNDKCAKLLNTYCEEMMRKPTRAPAVLWRAIKKSGQHPYILNEQWCWCYPVQMTVRIHTEEKLVPVMIHGNTPENINLYERLIK